MGILVIFSKEEQRCVLSYLATERIVSSTYALGESDVKTILDHLDAFSSNM